MQRIATTTIPYTELEVATGNYDETRQPITQIVLHTMVGTVAGAAARFDTVGTQVSAHYGVGYDGRLYHWLEEYYTAYHSGNYAVNQSSIGIEHEDMGNYNDPRPDALYATSAKLVADICKFYSIPCDTTHIVRHHDVPGASTACPDALDTTRIINSAQQILSGNTDMNKLANFFGIIWRRLFGDAVDLNGVTEDQVIGFTAATKVKSSKADKWDELCRLAGPNVNPDVSDPQTIIGLLQHDPRIPGWKQRLTELAAEM